MQIEVELRCQRCSYIYFPLAMIQSYYGAPIKPSYTIDPCPNCLVNERAMMQQEAWQKGYNDGHTAGRDAARKDLKEDIREMVKLTQEA